MRKESTSLGHNAPLLSPPCLPQGYERVDGDGTDVGNFWGDDDDDVHRHVFSGLSSRDDGTDNGAT
jgi:hypothetical protein